MIILDTPQYSPEYWAAKAGIPSASKFSQIVTTDGSRSKQRKDLLYQLAGEAILGKAEEGYQSYAMQIGLEREDEARLCFSKLYGDEVRQVGLIYRDEKKDALCSPDGLVGNTGLELKSPLLKTHVKYLLDNKLPTEYFQQVHGSMWIMDVDHYWFMSYYPEIQPLIKLVKRDYKFTDALEREVEAFNIELKQIIERLKN